MSSVPPCTELGPGPTVAKTGRRLRVTLARSDAPPDRRVHSGGPRAPRDLCGRARPKPSPAPGARPPAGPKDVPDTPPPPRRSRVGPHTRSGCHSPIVQQLGLRAQRERRAPSRPQRGAGAWRRSERKSLPRVGLPDKQLQYRGEGDPGPGTRAGRRQWAGQAGDGVFLWGNGEPRGRGGRGGAKLGWGWPGRGVQRWVSGAEGQDHNRGKERTRPGFPVVSEAPGHPLRLHVPQAGRTHRPAGQGTGRVAPWPPATTSVPLPEPARGPVGFSPGSPTCLEPGVSQGASESPCPLAGRG